jgi:hypothetical protein
LASSPVTPSIHQAPAQPRQRDRAAHRWPAPANKPQFGLNGPITYLATIEWCNVASEAQGNVCNGVAGEEKILDIDCSGNLVVKVRIDPPSASARSRCAVL